MLSIETFGQLQTPLGQEALAAAMLLAPTDASLLAHLARLRKAFPAEIAAAALETVMLRRRAQPKFSQASRMFFTREALEQASSEAVARHRAMRYRGVDQPVYDICCSIGGDALGLATSGLAVVGVDIDPLRLALAAANLTTYSVDQQVELNLADATTFGLPHGAFVFFDPARRRSSRTGAKRRVYQPEDYSPPLSLVEQWLDRAVGIGVKVAPGIDYDTLPYACEVELVSVGGDVKEACLWFGALRRHMRSATLLHSDGSLKGTLTATATPLITVDAPRAYLYEPDGAVIRAHLVEQLAEQINAVKIDEQIALLTNDTLIETPFARAFRVFEVMPFNLKRLRARLRELDVDRVVVKKRGSPIDPQVLEQQLRLSSTSGREMTLVLTHVLGKPSVVLCVPVTNPQTISGLNKRDVA